MTKKQKLSMVPIILLSFGFFGIQHGFSIQFAKMSSIYEKLGAMASEIPFLWLAAPLTGLLIQPIVGYMSDRTWGRFGRRRPYFLVGAILATVALFIMPNSKTLWTAAAMLWVLDLSINVSMEPFRAFVADILPEEQVATGYSVQTILIGIGGGLGFWIASKDWLAMFPSLSFIASDSLQLQFYITGLIFLTAVLVTVFTTKEYPPADMEAFKKMKAESKGVIKGVSSFFKELFSSMKDMPVPMKRLAWVQFFTWLGLFCMWIFYTVAVAHHIFGAHNPHSALYEKGISVASSSMITYQVVSTIFAFIMPWLVKKITAVGVHTLGLVAAGLGLLSMFFITDPAYLYVSMIGVGIGWATTLAMPYTILVSHIPSERYGIYMGIFNFFIVIPEIIAALGLGWIMKNLLNNNHLSAVIMGGIFMLIAAVILQSLRKFNKSSM